MEARKGGNMAEAMAAAQGELNDDVAFILLINLSADGICFSVH